LSLAKKLQVKTSEAKKDLAKQQAEQAAKASTLKSNIELLNRLQKTEHTKAEDWQRSQDKAIEYIKKTYERFEASRDHVVSGTCPECGTKLKDDVHTRKNGPNPCAAQLEAKLLEKNPHAGSVKDFSDEISAKEREFDKAEHFVKDMSEMISDYDTLLHVVDIFRSELIKNTVSYIEHNTNELLTKYFDAEICIQLDTAEKDKLDVTIQKDGNVATYTQLSKGQRQLLKLCFGVSVMQSVQNHNGVTFSQLFFDEALDGLDDELKIKAYKLLDNLALSHESVFVVEHNSALKSMFPNSYNVTLVNGSSCVERA
jgi:DNA repair exonuclease SbcCD ATPase subunit